MNTNKLSPQLVVIVVGFVLLGSIFMILLRLTGSAEVPSSQEETTAASQPTQVAQPLPAANDPNATTHVVVPGETLAAIARRYGVEMTAIINANNLSDPNLVQVGQSLIIPGSGGQQSITTSPATILLPDSALVYGPSAIDFDVEQAVPADSFLRNYRDDVEGTSLDGVAIVRLVAERTRVNPRLLLAALEHRSGWLTQSNPTPTATPLQTTDAQSGLYRQLEWAANQFNWGFYGRSEGGLTAVATNSGGTIQFDPAINDATAGVLKWLVASGASAGALTAEADAFMKTYRDLFGDPFEREVQFWPPSNQPQMALPWQSGETWYLTGGPHGGWASGSGWAALDFVPSDERTGCYDSDAWILAVADGVITRSDFGAVVLDLDGDGYSGTGWAVLYQHVATRDRIDVGERVRQGDRIGHPSCEGGYSTGTHLHIARTYNGRWVSADNQFPFDLGGWVSQGFGSEYNGALLRDGVTKSATVGRLGSNAITAD